MLISKLDITDTICYIAYITKTNNINGKTLGIERCLLIDRSTIHSNKEQYSLTFIQLLKHSLIYYMEFGFNFYKRINILLSKIKKIKTSTIIKKLSYLVNISNNNINNIEYGNNFIMI